MLGVWGPPASHWEFSLHREALHSYTGDFHHDDDNYDVISGDDTDDDDDF